ncbi:MAG: hypothetical protein HYV02_06515 [Deltaproteobacteria bacterium]|nr:hypothetical protein [Deltaproteobacteria bacterium]
MKHQHLGWALLCAVAMALPGTALAGLGSSLQGAAKSAAKGASKKAVESQINQRMAGKHCMCSGSAVDRKCFANVAGELKAQHTVAEQSGFADFNVYIKTPTPCRTQVETAVDAVFGYWDHYVSTKSTGEEIDFSVKLN